jgi:hypothetical protein
MRYCVITYRSAKGRPAPARDGARRGRRDCASTSASALAGLSGF